MIKLVSVSRLDVDPVELVVLMNGEEKVFKFSTTETMIGIINSLLFTERYCKPEESE